MQLRILLSYWYYKDVDLDVLFAKYFTPPYPDVFADSGGFSAMTQGADISVDDYANWVKRYKHLFSVYANLDIIGNHKETHKNQIILEDKYGLSPVPVVHAAKDYSPLEFYLSKGYRYIALGGLVPYASNSKLRMQYLIKAFKMAGQEAVFHGFGVTSWEVMSQLRWYSVDSSSWGSGFRFGVVPLFDSRRGKFEKAKLGNIKECIKHQRLFEELGFDWKDFADRKRNDRAKICAISALSYIKAEQYLRRKFGEVYIPGSHAPEVLRAHLADANPVRFSEAASGLRLHLADTGGIKENYARAENGIKYGDADRGVKVYGAVAGGTENQAPAKNMSIASVSEAMDGINLYLSDAGG